MYINYGTTRVWKILYLMIIHSVGCFLFPCLIVIVTEEFFIYYSLYTKHPLQRARTVLGFFFLFKFFFFFCIFLFFPITLTDVFNLTLFLSARATNHTTTARGATSFARGTIDGPSNGL